MRLYATMRALFYAPLYVALARRCFEREGLEVEFSTAPHPDDAVPALLEDRVDVTLGGPIDLMLHYDTAADPVLVGFCEIVARDPFVLVGREMRERFSFQDLAALRVAPVSEVETPWLCLQEDIRRSGLDPAPFTPQPGRTMRENALRLERGEMDVVQLFEPFAQDLIARGKGHLWYAGATRGLNTYTTLFTTKRNLTRLSPHLGAMVRAMNAALEWLHCHTGADIASEIGSVFPEFDVATMGQALDRYKRADLWARTTVHHPVGFVRLKSAVLAGGWIKNDIAFERCIDTEIAHAARAAR